MNQITVTIDENGSSRVEVNGVQGPDCKQLTQQLEKALGSTIGSVHKPEFYEVAKQQQKAVQ